jgi:sulfatase maturation enzyme AslB (radical SAM superfamily)
MTDEKFDHTEASTKADAFCILPWIHMSFQPYGEVFTCCARGPKAKALGNTKTQAAHEIWNSDAMKTLRKDMLAGRRREDMCGNCYQMESVQLKSSRQIFNEMFAKYIEPKVAATQSDGSLQEMQFVYWDFRFSNICNFRCRMCGSHNSSAWEPEAIKIWFLDDRSVQADPQKLFQIAEQQIPYVERINFAGGEPLLMIEHYKILQALISAGKTNVPLDYSTNLSVLGYQEYDVIQLWQCFTNLNISPSIDHFGAKAEYIRKGTRWENIVENARRVRAEVPWAKMQPSVTVSLYNILDITEIHEHLYELGIIARSDPSAFYLNLLRSPVHLQISVLPKNLKDIALEKIYAYQAQAERKWGTRLPQFDVLVAPLQADDTKYADNFKDFNQRLDALRDEKFLSLFPEYQSF